MKDFMMKHPIVALLMLDTVCCTIESIVTGCGNKSRMNSVRNLWAAVTNKVNEETCDLDIEAVNPRQPMGFHFVKEES